MEPKVCLQEEGFVAENLLQQEMSKVLNLHDQRNGKRYGVKSSQSMDCIVSANWILEP